jgi:hypothetical protein
MLAIIISFIIYHIILSLVETRKDIDFWYDYQLHNCTRKYKRKISEGIKSEYAFCMITIKYLAKYTVYWLEWTIYKRFEIFDAIRTVSLLTIFIYFILSVLTN